MICNQFLRIAIPGPNILMSTHVCTGVYGTTGSRCLGLFIALLSMTSCFFCSTCSHYRNVTYQSGPMSLWPRRQSILRWIPSGLMNARSRVVENDINQTLLCVDIRMDRDTVIQECCHNKTSDNTKQMTVRNTCRYKQCCHNKTHNEDEHGHII